MKRVEGSALKFGYAGQRPAVDGVDVSLPAGELAVIVGPNGAGKSTLLKLLAGLLRPQAGRVELDGVPVAELGTRARARRIALVPQALRALPDARVESFVLGGRYAHRGRWGGRDASDHEAVEQALDQCDLAGLGGRFLTELSGGERQRVLVARALAQEADLLLVDEPTNSLDPEHQVRVFSLIDGLVHGGRAAAVVTHDLSLAGQFATRILLLHHGRVAREGRPEEVLQRACLEPVYGRHLHYGRGPGRGGEPGRPFVLPWLTDP